MMPEDNPLTIEHCGRPAVAAGQPRWPAVVASIAVGLLFNALPQTLTVGPRWRPLALVSTLMSGAQLMGRARERGLNSVLALTGLGVITAGLVCSLGVLVVRLPTHNEPPSELLRAAAALWVGNVLIFASWYWRLDGGGPYERDRRGVHTDGAFLFPQMQMDQSARVQMGEDKWSPGFVDYLFLAFNTSTAFSPSDVPVLSRWAKAMMMIQSTISLTTIALLAARAVNIL
jgi:hypothetical protein